jgi:acyl-CoA thioester hydrolase
MRHPYKLSVPIQVRFRDTDAMGHINNAVYLSYLEVARTEYWHRVIGVASYNDVDFVVARIEIDFLAQARIEDEIDVWIRVSAMGTKSFRFVYEIVRRRDRQVIVRAETVQVMYDYATQRSKPLSDTQRQKMLEFEESGEVAVRS